MTEKKRIIRLFNDHYDGSPWLDLNIVDQLNNISAATAAKKIGQCNSIWQLVYHMMEWRKQNMKRISGKPAPAPAHNFIIDIKDQSENAWYSLVKEFEDTHHQFIAFLETFDMRNLNLVYEGNGHTYYEHIQGILVHDAYHLGQIVLLCKLIHQSM